MSDPDAQDRRISTLEREMGEVRKILLLGNGQPPLVTQLASVTQQMRSVVWLVRATLGGVVTLILDKLF